MEKLSRPLMFTTTIIAGFSALAALSIASYAFVHTPNEALHLLWPVCFQVLIFLWALYTLLNFEKYESKTLESAAVENARLSQNKDVRWAYQLLCFGIFWSLSSPSWLSLFTTPIDFLRSSPTAAFPFAAGLECLQAVV